jgi:hypothetical protein
MPIFWTNFFLIVSNLTILYIYFSIIYIILIISYYCIFRAHSTKLFHVERAPLFAYFYWEILDTKLIAWRNVASNSQSHLTSQDPPTLLKLNSLYFSTLNDLTFFDSWYFVRPAICKCPTIQTLQYQEDLDWTIFRISEEKQLIINRSNEPNWLQIPLITSHQTPKSGSLKPVYNSTVSHETKSWKWERDNLCLRSIGWVIETRSYRSAWGARMHIWLWRVHTGPAEMRG